MNNAQTDMDTEPQKIFFGGNFLYSYNGITHEAFVALDGKGNYVAGVSSSTQYGIYGDGSGYRGIRSMHLIDDSLYVAGDFRGYDSSSDGTAFTDDFQLLLRFDYDGTSLDFDDSYAPLSFAALGSSAFSVWDVESYFPDPDNRRAYKLAAGGDFFIGAQQYLSIFELSGAQTSDQPLPDISSGSYVSKLYLLDDSTLLIAGAFDTIDSVSPYLNLAILDLATYDAAAPADTLYDDPADPLVMTDIYDVLLTPQNELYIAGRNRNALAPDQTGVLRKYVYDETDSRFVSDSDFHNAFRAEFTRTDENSTTADFDQVHCLAIDGDGYIYIGGDFRNMFDINLREHRGLLRIDSTGQIDPSFYPSVRGQVYVMEFQENGKLLAGGYINNVNNFEIDSYFRLDQYGNLDESFYFYGIPDLDESNQPTIYSIIVEEIPQE